MSPKHRWLPEFHSPFGDVKWIAPERNRRQLSMFDLVPSPATYDEEYATIQLCSTNNSDPEEQDCGPSPRMPSKLKEDRQEGPEPRKKAALEVTDESTNSVKKRKFVDRDGVLANININDAAPPYRPVAKAC
ncbi:uncharacterized protein LAESUDRAFT_764627 [Laetiporus sulphureus 93-53]|uniref:Uncharacterized protein n=1 Tax=Laetiporus sulphureus 93-53 TaxID=1314785 RepID=A0A165B7I8_9APHY|nr:uncharacterized protein LAESUDRAFT_764627 [Laetiporus sulphureus 93-53]KZT00424.1 hypothetical protein LAESUDRAFT_764627 [Laetiporus sulphureus 93-53]